MSIETPSNNPEQKEVVDDNARKFLIEPLNPAFLRGASLVTLTTHFLDDQKKIVHKDFGNNKIEIWLIEKVTDKDGNRTAERQQMPEEDYSYEELYRDSIFTYKKDRFQFNYPAKNGVRFSCNYDKFDGGKLCMLEVDAPSEEARNSFNPGSFPVPLTEVTGAPGYTGSEIIDTLQALAQEA
jgi:hypothetical protein